MNFDKELSRVETDELWGWNDPLLTNGEDCYSVTKDEVDMVCSCGNCGDYSHITLTKEDLVELLNKMNELSFK